MIWKHNIVIMCLLVLPDYCFDSLLFSSSFKIFVEPEEDTIIEKDLTVKLDLQNSFQYTILNIYIAGVSVSS